MQLACITALNLPKIWFPFGLLLQPTSPFSVVVAITNRNSSNLKFYAQGSVTTAVKSSDKSLEAASLDIISFEIACLLQLVDLPLPRSIDPSVVEAAVFVLASLILLVQDDTKNVEDVSRDFFNHLLNSTIPLLQTNENIWPQ